MSIKKKFIPIRVEEHLHKEIKGLAFHADLPMNTFVVQIIQEYLDKIRRHKIKK